MKEPDWANAEDNMLKTMGLHESQTESAEYRKGITNKQREQNIGYATSLYVNAFIDSKDYKEICERIHEFFNTKIGLDKQVADRMSEYVRKLEEERQKVKDKSIELKTYVANSHDGMNDILEQFESDRQKICTHELVEPISSEDGIERWICYKCGKNIDLRPGGLKP